MGIEDSTTWDNSQASEGGSVLAPNNLPPPRRLITTHTSDGKSVFYSDLSEEPHVQVLDPRASAALAYVTKLPASLRPEADISNYAKVAADPPGLTISNSAVLRWYDIGPGVESPLHRTMSIDYLVVLFGEVDLVLDSGESRTMRPGEVVVQRGTFNSWRNKSSDWVRTLAITIPVGNIVVGGKEVGEELEDIQGFKRSA
ncbi:RmlC-like cupin domain-containing protein [Xylaria venustula]|nr:RmlC-like cupin domain-containing protein [Xylaria venustula]